MSFCCKTHGVYGGEFPFPTSCGYCEREARLIQEERARIINILETSARYCVVDTQTNYAVMDEDLRRILSENIQELA